MFILPVFWRSLFCEVSGWSEASGFRVYLILLVLLVLLRTLFDCLPWLTRF